MGTTLLVFVALVTGAAISTGNHKTQLPLANPIKKVVRMPQSMRANVQEEGKIERVFCNKYMSYISELGNEIKVGEERIVVLTEKLTTVEADQGAAEAATANATANTKGGSNLCSREGPCKQ